MLYCIMQNVKIFMKKNEGIQYRVIREGISEKVVFAQRFEGSGGVSYEDYMGRTFWAEGTRSTKALRLDYAWCV